MPTDPTPAPQPSGAIVEVAPGVFALESALRIQYARSSGPGGQNVNKLNTRAELWLPLTAIRGLNERALDRLSKALGRRLTQAGEIHLSAESERSQQANREALLARLRELLLQARIEPKSRRRTRPTRASRERRLESKQRRSKTKRLRRENPSA